MVGKDFMEVTHTSPSVPDLTLAVCRLHAVERMTETPDPLKKTPRFHSAAPPYIERICYTTFNYRAGYTAVNHIYAKETIIAAFREYTPSPFLPTPLRPSLWVVLTVHLALNMKHENVRNYLARLYFQDEGKDGQSELGRYYQAGKCAPSNVMFKDDKEVCEVTPHSESWKPQRNKVMSPPLAGTAASPKLQALAGVLAQQHKKAGSIIKHNTIAAKHLAATQAFPGDNVDEGSRSEPPAKKA
eukprot:jgi/Tetstr1/446099/TSEL_033699.t1